MKKLSYNLPSSGPAREALREKGQFWTPDWVAEAMVAYVIGGGCDTVFDPAVGAGAFFSAARVLEQETGRRLNLIGREVDPEALDQATANGLSTADLGGVEIRNFLLEPPAGKLGAIVANPPYIRHHRLGAELKSYLRDLATRLIGKPLDGRAGVHVYFLLRALELLSENARLAFIMPADTCEGVFAPRLWTWVARRFRLEAVVAFTPDASPFPGVDTNALIFFIRKAPPEANFLWAQCNEPLTDELKKWTLSQFTRPATDALRVYRRSIGEGLATGLSRPPGESEPDSPTLGQYAMVLRGIATGANEYFFLTRTQAAALRLPDSLLLPAVGRTRDVHGDELTTAALDELNATGRPTLLFSPDGRPVSGYQESVREYLKRGEEMGLPHRPLIATRQPWYKMEVRQVPPLLFAYLGRRNARFVKNTAKAIPLTGFLCVYPRRSDPPFVEALWHFLRRPEIIANLRLVGKSYGQGCIKVEPRALERLALPREAGSTLGPKLTDGELPFDSAEKHYKLVPPEELDEGELKAYRESPP